MPSRKIPILTMLCHFLVKWKMLNIEERHLSRQLQVKMLQQAKGIRILMVR